MIEPQGPMAWAAVAVAGVVVGRLLTALVTPLLAVDPDGRPVATDARVARGVRVAAVLGAVALWWWEVVAAGEMPRVGGAVAGGPLVARYAAHLILFALLAAATWVDLRHRVIPDAITVPGVLAGLACCGLAPATLLPIAVEVPRSFALPLLDHDLLGLVGGLRSTPLPWWLEPRPVWSGLLAALAVFGCWWAGCTAPLLTPAPGRRGPGAWLAEPRHLALVAGLCGIAAAWWSGGMAWRGLLTGLAGLLVAAGMVWLLREGASRALAREALGFGDVTLMAMMGTWLGWQACVLICFLAVFIGLTHGLLQVITRRGSELPFGPSLCLAAVLVVVAWRPLWARVGAAFEQPLEMAVVIAAVILLTALTLLAWQRMRARPAN